MFPRKSWRGFITCLFEQEFGKEPVGVVDVIDGPVFKQEEDRGFGFLHAFSHARSRGDGSGFAANVIVERGMETPTGVAVLAHGQLLGGKVVFDIGDEEIDRSLELFGAFHQVVREQNLVRHGEESAVLEVDIGVPCLHLRRKFKSVHGSPSVAAGFLNRGLSAANNSLATSVLGGDGAVLEAIGEEKSQNG